MIVQCKECETRYQLEANKVPAQRIRVRCPKCRYVFSMDGSANREMVPETVGAAAPGGSGGGFGDISLSAPANPLPPSDSSANDFEIERNASAFGGGASVPEPGTIDLEPTGSNPAVAEAAPEAAPEPAAAPAPAPAAPAASAAPSTRRSRREGKDDPSRRLARALVSDILVYNREQRDQSLKSGKLVQVLGPEIKKSWELYKEKVTPEVANSTNHFREALNEILAEGQKIF